MPALAPGLLAQIALDVPPGAVPEGDSFFALTADDGLVVADVNRDNNTSRFAVNYFVDIDGDGMPDQWERDNFLDPNNPADAAEDFDGDDVSNLTEYRAGTSIYNDRSLVAREAAIDADCAVCARISGHQWKDICCWRNGRRFYRCA